MLQQCECLVAAEGLLAGPEEEAVGKNVPGQGKTREGERREKGNGGKVNGI